MIAATAAAASTAASGWPSSRLPSGTQSAASSEPSDTYRKLSVTTSHTGIAGSTASGTTERSAPSPVATPLPPRKSRNTDQQLPATAATAPAAAAGGAIRAPSATAP